MVRTQVRVCTVNGLLRCVFFFNDTATTEIYTLSLHDALPIWVLPLARGDHRSVAVAGGAPSTGSFLVESVAWRPDRKSTRLNSSHKPISYAVFCLKKKMHMYATSNH